MRGTVAGGQADSAGVAMPPIAAAPFSEGLPVRLIETPRGAMRTCRSDELLRTVAARNSDDKFDYFPVTAGPDQSRIIGLVDLRPFHEEDAPAVAVSDHLKPMTEGMVIGADASIISFIRDADANRCRLVVSGSEISGLVTLEDIQKLPVRAALFAIVTQLEMAMSAAIRRAFPTDAWMECISEGRRQSITQHLRQSRIDDTYVDALLFTQFADKREILGKSGSLGTEKVFEDDMKQIEHLRNQLAHANAYKAEDACVAVRLIDRRLAEITRWSRTGVQAGD